MPPLILTLLLDPATQARLDAERAAHFPAERNHLHAHVTLFHHLPGEDEQGIRLRLLALRTRAPLPLRLAAVRSLGRGVAYTLEGDALPALRGELARDWAAALTAQDRQGFRPHVTIQNKVTPAEAAALLDHLRARFTPVETQGVGLALWRYLGGPWEAVDEVRFEGK